MLLYCYSTLTCIFDLTTNGGGDVFVLKLGGNGNFIWARSLGGVFNDNAYSIVTDVSGNIFITGAFVGTVDFDPGGGTFNLTTNNLDDIFVLKLDAGGNFIWANSMGGGSADYGHSITTDDSGNVYVTGGFGSMVDFDPGVNNFNLTSNGDFDIFVHKSDASGNFVWAKSMGGISTDVGRSITTDGAVYVTGHFEDTVDFDPGINNFNLISNGGNDVFIQKLDAGGNFIWARSMGGLSSDLGLSITIDPAGNVYGVGSFQDTVEFDPSAVTFNLTSNGGNDVFIQKLGPCAPIAGTDVITACDSINWIDGNTYTSNNNTATFKIVGGAANGCDSLVTIDLTITNSATGTDVRIECDSLVWLNGNTYTSNNNTATFNIVGGAANGCDSLVVLDLLIINSATGTDIQSACITFDWIDGNIYSSSNDTATYNIIGGATNGCDSLVSLDLTINTVDVNLTVTDPSITANATGASYQWLDCINNYAVISGETAKSFTATANGDYGVEVTKNACTDTSTCITISTVGTEGITLFNNVSIFPNPNQGLVNIDLSGLKEVSLKVFNAGGHLIYHRENINASIHQFELDEAPGIYLVEISCQGEEQQYKLVKK